MDELSKKDLVEGEEAFERFDLLVGKVLSVPREEILRRHAEHKKRSIESGNKRGPLGQDQVRRQVSSDPEVPKWVDSLTDRCLRTEEALDSKLKLSRPAVDYWPNGFQELVKDMEFAAEYFRLHCQKAEHIMHSAKAPSEFSVQTDVPPPLRVRLLFADSIVHYEKPILDNSQSELQTITGKLLVKTSYQSYRLEHDGIQMSTEEAAEFLLKDMFELVLSAEPIE